MISACGRLVITFNGEIYNFKELRNKLESMGHHFRGESDTEVMLASISEWGIERAVKKFIGMFAFAVWDKKERRLSLVRDRLGIKPLYYCCSQKLCFFGSELKSLRAYRGWQPEIDRMALAEMLRLGYVPAPSTIYENVKKIPPGMILHMDIEDGWIRSRPPRPFWSFSEAYSGLPEPADEKEALEGLDTLLKDAVRLRMIADVPLGAFLSGGIDSSLVTALMQAQSSQPVKTFSIGFENNGYDEASFAGAVSRHLGTEHHDLYIRESDLLHLIPEIPQTFDEPFADPSQLPTRILSQLAREYVTVALSGDGGDELFAGYVRHFQAERLERLQKTVPQALCRPVSRLLSVVPDSRWDRVFHILSCLTGKSMTLPGDKIHKLADFMRAGTDDLYENVVSVWKNSPVLAVNPNGIFSESWWKAASSRMNQAEIFMYRDAVRYLPDDVLTKVDRSTMAVALEARVPLLDHQVVEYARSLPLEMKLRDGESKWLLKKLLAKYVPQNLWDRPKMGFSVPLAGWLRGPLKTWAEDMLSEYRLKRDAFLDSRKIHQAWKNLQSGSSTAQYRIWNVLIFQSWLEKWM